MKYFTIEVSELKDGTWAQTINAYDSHDDAKSRYHEFMRYQMTVGTVKMALCMVTSEQGVTDITDRWEAPIENGVESTEEVAAE